MGKVINFSDKHGVNPSMSICIFCGEPKGVALLGKLKGDVEAPREIITDYEPCSKCREKFNKGVPIIEVSNTPILDNQPPLTKDSYGLPVYPTGCYLVLNPDALGGGYKKGEITLSIEQDFRRILETMKQYGGTNNG